MTSQEYRAGRDSPPNEPCADSEDRLWSIVFTVDEAIIQGSPVPALEDPELAEDALEQLRGIKDCLMLLARSRRYLQSREWPESSEPEDVEGLLDFAAEELPGPRFGRFEIVDKLGDGGSGMVYLAIDPRLDRKVALKIPLPAWLLSGELRQRFVREARLAAQLDHRNIVSIYEVGEMEPFSYIASEYCAGDDLAKWLAGRHSPVSPRSAAEFIASLCDGVQYAHSRGVLHRDIKPSNILLACADGGEEPASPRSELSHFIPKIADFGLAKLIEDADDLTRTGAIVGTLRYLTPEQADGRTADISVRTDVYALGTVLYELLTGRPVNPGTTNVEILQHILLAEIEPPRRLNPAVPNDLSAICVKALQKSPADRYETAAELRADLMRYLSGQTVTAREASIAERGYRWVRRRPALATLSFLAVATTAALVASTMAYNNRLVTTAGDLQRQVNANAELLYARNVQLANDAWHGHHTQEAIAALRSQLQATGAVDLQDFSWRYLWNQCNSELATFTGHKGDVYNVTFSPDGKLLASAGKDRTVRLWDVNSRKLLKTLSGHQGEVNTVGFVSQTQLASASDDGTVRLWDLRSGELLASLDAQDGPVFGLAIEKDGQTLASGGQSGKVRLWSIPGRAEIWASPPNAQVEALAITWDSRTLVSSHADASVRCWNVASRENSFVAVDVADSPVSVACSSELALFAIASRTGQLATLRQSDATSWNEVNRADLDTKAVGIHALAFSPRDNTLATGTRDGLLEIWDVGRSKLLPGRYLPGHRNRVWSVAWSPDGKLLASASAGGDIKLWNFVTSSLAEMRFPLQPSPVNSIAVSSGAIVSTCVDGRIREWSTNGRYVRRTYPVPQNHTSLVACSRNSRSKVVAASLRQVQQIDLESGLTRVVAELPETVRSLAVSEDGSIAAMGCEHQTAMLFDTRSWQLLHRLTTRTLDAHSVALSPDGRLLATAGVGPEIEIWNTASGRVAHVLPGHFSRTTCLVFLADSRTLVSGGTNEEVCFWNAASGELLSTLIGRPSAINTLAVSPDGRTLAVGSFLPSWVDLWDVETRSKFVELKNFREPALALAFSPDGNSLFAGMADGEIVEWSGNSKPRMPRLQDDGNLVSVLEYVPILDDDHDDRKSAADTSGCVGELQIVCEYARRNGFVAGYPTFATTAGNSPTMEIVLIRPENTQELFVSQCELGERRWILQSDYRTQSDLLASILLQADLWAKVKGFKGALPTGRCKIGDDGALHYEYFALFRAGFARQRMPIANTEELQDMPQFFHKVHEWAKMAGFLSGFPTGRSDNLQVECVLLSTEQGEVRSVSISDLQRNTAGSSQEASRQEK